MGSCEVSGAEFYSYVLEDYLVKEWTLGIEWLGFDSQFFCFHVVLLWVSYSIAGDLSLIISKQD